MKEPMKIEDYSKEQLLIFLRNNDLIIKELHWKLELLTGCATFGDSDGTDGGCIDCYYDNQAQWSRCQAFYGAWKKYRKEKLDG
jgi:hypothetical protein